MFRGAKKRTFRFGKKNVSFPKVETFRFADYTVEHILETYSYLIGEERKVIELANEAGDDATADLMTGYLKEQEKMVWMLVAFSTKSCTK